MSDDIHRYPSQLADRFQVRMPEGLRERIAEAAKANGRSMNAEIVARLEATLAREPMSPDALRKLVFGGNPSQEEVDNAPAPEDVLTEQLQQAVHHAIEDAMARLADAGLVTMLWDNTRPENPPLFHKPSRRHKR